MNNHNCRVCGLYIEDLPWGDDDKSPTFEICPCCGVEFGNEDYTVESAKKYRSEWVKRGLNWFDSNEKPVRWDWNLQSKQIPQDWR